MTKYTFFNVKRMDNITGNSLIYCAIVLSMFFSHFHPAAARTTYEFDEGIEVLVNGLIQGMKLDKPAKIAVFGTIDDESKVRWKISSDLEAGIAEVLAGAGLTVLERDRINDVIKKEQKNIFDDGFDESKFKEVGRLAGADILVTGKYRMWNDGHELKVSIKAIDAESGQMYAASKVSLDTVRIAKFLVPDPTNVKSAKYELNFVKFPRALLSKLIKDLAAVKGYVRHDVENMEETSATLNYWSVAAQDDLRSEIEKILENRQVKFKRRIEDHVLSFKWSHPVFD